MTHSIMYLYFIKLQLNLLSAALYRYFAFGKALNQDLLLSVVILFDINLKV